VFVITQETTTRPHRPRDPVGSWKSWPTLGHQGSNADKTFKGICAYHWEGLSGRNWTHSDVVEERMFLNTDSMEACRCCMQRCKSFKVCSSFVYQTVAIGLTQPWRESLRQNFTRAQAAFARSWGNSFEFPIPVLSSICVCLSDDKCFVFGFMICSQQCISCVFRTTCSTAKRRRTRPHLRSSCMLSGRDLKFVATSETTRDQRLTEIRLIVPDVPDIML